ncbi:hypothetical protein HPB50_021549 [Hyalomma asiaticum]|uniref:Uncharacterized protein n=1 Tax=Hyalomma asiaticum TaxID=266040 RepID=A0ACB7TLY8_HYAAI|nr:hypothetical protein HPB50_021549 [Hyalomma asiaticum]
MGDKIRRKLDKALKRTAALYSSFGKGHKSCPPPLLLLRLNVDVLEATWSVPYPLFRQVQLMLRSLFTPKRLFFIIPCIDTYCKVDLRTVSFDVPPQEARLQAGQEMYRRRVFFALGRRNIRTATHDKCAQGLECRNRIPRAYIESFEEDLFERK